MDLYETYRDHLYQLADDSFICMVIGWASSRWPDWEASELWKRAYARFDPGCAPYATLLLQQPSCSYNICLIEVYEKKPQSKYAKTLECSHPSLGWLQLRRFPDDPILTSLERALDGMTRIEVLRYRPYKRCTFKLESGSAAKPIFGKVFADQRGERIDKESRALWHASEQGDLGFNVARPIRWDSRKLTLWQTAVDGTPLIGKLFRQGGGQIAERIGSASGSITQSGLKPSLRFDGSAQLKRSKKYAVELTYRLPDLENSLTGLLDKLKKAHAHLSDKPLMPLHGAPHAHQWLDAGDKLGLVDFDRICLGDPELDAATFVAEMDFEDRDAVPVDELNGIFLEAYQTVAGKLDAHLLQAYRSHKRLAKALKASRALRVNGERKARKHLDFAWQALRD